MLHSNITTRFSGHETFPLRHGWLYKGLNHLNKGSDLKPSSTDSVINAVIELGIGKNMVSSLRYWLEILGLVDFDKDSLQISDLAKNLFLTENAWDPYLEKIGSVWLLHWMLCKNTLQVTSIRWFFNNSSIQTFSKDMLVDLIMDDVQSVTPSQIPSNKTLEKDIDCFLNSYVNKISQSKSVSEDSFSSPFVELGLVHASKNKGAFSTFEKRPSLPIQIFAYATIDFWKRNYPDSKTITYDNLLMQEGSPGKVFRLSIDGLNEMLDNLSAYTDKKIAWSDTMGLRQIKCEEITNLVQDTFLNDFYS